MSNPFGALRSRYDRITISTIHVAFALSLLLHLMAMWNWSSKIKMRPFEDTRMGEQGGSLAVRIVQPPSAPPRPQSVESQLVPERRLVMPRSASRPAAAASSAPRLLTAERQARSASMAPPPPRPADAARPAAGEDLASYIEARRRNREPESQPSPASPASQASAPSESEQARQNREAAARLGFSATPTFGSNKNLGGGTFQVRSIGIERAELAFYGWNKFIKRISLQVFEVPRGSNPSTQHAVVRKIIEIIRDQESDNFTWESLRLRRDLTLSARPADNAALEAFMMEEFFSDGRLR